MDKKYTILFRDLAQATAAAAEQVMDYDSQNHDEKGFETAKTMRDDFQALAESIDNLHEDYQINKGDIARLLIAAMIQVNQLQSRSENIKKAMAGFQTDVIPKLQEILDNAKDDEDAAKMANEKFIIKEE
jgi:gas vesicle protein